MGQPAPRSDRARAVLLIKGILRTSSFGYSTAGCADVDPGMSCTHNRLNRLFGGTVCMHHAIRVNHTEIRCRAVVSAVDPLLRASASAVNRLRDGVGRGIVRASAQRWVNTTAHRYRHFGEYVQGEGPRRLMLRPLRPRNRTLPTDVGRTAPPTCPSSCAAGPLWLRRGTACCGR
jgi:hypothetical protein